MHRVGTGWLQRVVQVPHPTILWLLCGGVKSKHKLAFWRKFYGPASPLPSHCFVFPIKRTVGWSLNSHSVFLFSPPNTLYFLLWFLTWGAVCACFCIATLGYIWVDGFWWQTAHQWYLTTPWRALLQGIGCNMYHTVKREAVPITPVPAFCFPLPPG